MPTHRSHPSSDSPSSGRIRPSEPGAPVQIGRYRILEHLGAGGMGVVYVALDTERNERVALKTLQSMSPEGLLRLKNEFRSVADVIHPNLVVLHELVGEGDDWFFTMELVHGRTFLEYVRGASSGQQSTARLAETLLAPTSENSAELQGPNLETVPSAQNPVPPATTLSVERLERLRNALKQLAEGVSALHTAGKLHRDLKPSNVMVTAEGRIVILDFGLVSDALPGAGTRSSLAGTPAYMAPELALLQPASTASDWYAVGVMLYEALTGALPHDADTPLKMFREKARIRPQAPRTRIQNVPQDLDELCMALLAIKPSERPEAADVLARVGSALSESSARTTLAPPMSNSTVLGREAELSALEEAFAAVSRGTPTTIYIGGRSGMGKSTLCESFLQRLGAREKVLVLRGRCYERESLPFKAFDSIVDALARFLASLRAEELHPLLPESARELARVFPVLLELKGFAAPPRDEDSAPDPNELRQRAFSGLKELFSRIAARSALVLYIDDLQWGDIDSARLFEELVSPPAPPAALLLCSYRSEEIDKSPFLSKILDSKRSLAGDSSSQILEIGPLSFECARELALALMSARGSDAERRAASIARESGGSPLFVEQLVRHAESLDTTLSETERDADTKRSDPPKKEVSLDELVAARVALLAPEPRRLLEVIAVAGGPVQLGVVLAAANIGRGAYGLLTTLRNAHLVRSLGVSESDTVESYHDRIRESVYSRLGAELRSARHASIANELERRTPEDVARLALHFSGAGERVKASSYAEIAAEKAFTALAFERAAEFYRLALDTDEIRDSAPDSPRLAALHEKMGEALAAAGRGAEAAPHYFEASKRVASERATALRSLGAQHLLSSGHFEEGRAVLQPLLEQVGIPWPKTPSRALMSALYGLIRLKLRGRSFQPRTSTEISPEARTTLDVCASAVKGLLSFDPVRAASFLMRYTRLALDIGEPVRAAWGLMVYGMILMYEGSPSGFAQGMNVFDEVEQMDCTRETPFLRANLAQCRGIGQMGITNFAEGVELVQQALSTFRKHCTGVDWECNTAISAIAESLSWLGRFNELRDMVLPWKRQAERLGNVFALVAAQLSFANIELAGGDPNAARKSAREAMKLWFPDTYTHQHWYADRIEITSDLYEGNIAGAQSRLDITFGALRSADLMRVQYVRINVLQLRAAIALAQARNIRTALMHRRAEKDAKTLAQLGTPCAKGASELAFGMLAARLGRDSEAQAKFRSAAESFDTAGMIVHAAVVRRHLGIQCGGDNGRREREAAEAILHGQGIRDPARFCAIILPASA